MLYVFCVEWRDKIQINKKYNAYSVAATNNKRPRVDFAFDSLRLPNDSAGYPGLGHVVQGTTP